MGMESKMCWGKIPGGPSSVHFPNILKRKIMWAKSCQKDREGKWDAVCISCSWKLGSHWHRSDRLQSCLRWYKAWLSSAASITTCPTVLLAASFLWQENPCFLFVPGRIVVVQEKCQFFTFFFSHAVKGISLAKGSEHQHHQLLFDIFLKNSLLLS